MSILLMVYMNPDNNSNYLATYVKKKRKEKHMTQAELAKKAGVGISFIRHLEHGKDNLLVNKVNQVLKVFGDCLRPGAIIR